MEWKGSASVDLKEAIQFPAPFAPRSPFNLITR